MGGVAVDRGRGADAVRMNLEVALCTDNLDRSVPPESKFEFKMLVT